MHWDLSLNIRVQTLELHIQREKNYKQNKEPDLDTNLPARYMSIYPWFDDVRHDACERMFLFLHLDLFKTRQIVIDN